MSQPLIPILIKIKLCIFFNVPNKFDFIVILHSYLGDLLAFPVMAFEYASWI